MNDSGAEQRAAVKRVRVLCFEWKKNPFPWKERGLTSEAIELFACCASNGRKIRSRGRNGA
jgi:hypothetical protein